MATIVNADAWRRKVICTGNKLKPEAVRAALSLRMFRLAALALARSLIVAPALAGEYTSFQHVEMPSPATRDCRSVALPDPPATWRAGDGAVVLQTSGPPHATTRDQLVAALLIDGVAVLERVAAPYDAVPGRDDGIARDTEPCEETEVFMAEGAVGTLVLPAGAPDRRTPAVVILPDALGADLRSAIYTAQLLGAGFAVLDLATVAGEGGLAAALEALAQHPRVEGQPVGLLGFGAGARIAARWPDWVAARVLLYPGCADVDPVAMQGQALLLLHGAEDPANAPADRARVIGAIAASGASARARVYPGAGYAWGYYTNGGAGGVLFPRPEWREARHGRTLAGADRARRDRGRGLLRQDLLRPRAMSAARSVLAARLPMLTRSRLAGLYRAGSVVAIRPGFGRGLADRRYLGGAEAHAGANSARSQDLARPALALSRA